jgi:hemerythrin
MRPKNKSVSMWQESMRVGLPELDEERKNVLEILELLEVRPLYSIASETFAGRFKIVQAAVEELIRYEENLLHEYRVPDETRRRHIADHEKIRTKLQRIRADSMNKKNQTALDVYRSLRNEIKKHVLTFDLETSKHIRPAKVVKDSVMAAPAEQGPA